ncbi:hypothetical protein [Parasphingorhabdus cellanae]|uniref:Uncharacterized protein n=1 Tax=Parasphingorhabdus cellanae TaxID=2806553 RepID=A0ABX7T9J4_9SPHN|nr:hypothetical protein [Parasphingorhabdus cellanae]QTD57224.1 hypothetical protein J4G78_06685 [Parasphingorhabdus cellanae]
MPTLGGEGIAVAIFPRRIVALCPLVIDNVCFYFSLMIINITKGSDQDWIKIKRQDGSVEQTTFPKKGTIPHDAVHYHVEQVLAMRQGFWGMVADGTRPEDIQHIAKEAGHASSTRAATPKAQIIELLQAERLVECFEADMWSESSDNQTLRDVFNAACQSSYIDPPALSDDQINTIRSSISAFAKQWMAAEIGETFQLHWK